MRENASPGILLAAYHFPPSAAVGGLRITRFARLLPGFGWRRYVLTVDNADRQLLQGTDHSRLRGLDDLSITRTSEPSGVFDLYSRMKRAVHQRRRRGQEPSAHTAPALDARDANGTSETIVQRLKRYVTSLLVYMPDEEKNWALRAALPAVRLIRKHQIDWILTSGPPHSTHFIGLIASALTPVRWAADFRDPWVEFIHERSATWRSEFSERLEHWMEASVMQRADRVLTTTERMRESILARYPHLPPAKFVCLPNGIDVGGVLTHDVPEKFGPLTITYAGSLYLDRTPEPLFRALGELVSEGKARLDDVRIKLVGSCRTIGHVSTAAIARRYGVEPAVEIIDRVPHAEAIQIMQRSHLLLVLAPPNHNLCQPAKIFDYLGSGSKLLALAEPGATTDLIQETHGGMCFSHTDINGLKDYVHHLLIDGAYRALRNDPESFRRYEARNLTHQLVTELMVQPSHPDAVIVQTQSPSN